MKKYFTHLVLLTFTSLASVASCALPLAFEFKGTISESVLVSGIFQTAFTRQPEWNGLKVSGTLVMDLQDLAASPYNDLNYIQYSKSEHSYDYANWMAFSITNPDGSVLDISDAVPLFPAPEAEADDAYTYLAYHSHYLGGDSGFYAQRTYDDPPYPRNHTSLSLRASGQNAELLVSGANYNDVIIRPEFANSENYGYVYQLNDQGIGYEYNFRIDSLARATSKVPESGSLTLMILGFASLLLSRIRKRIAK